MKNQLFLKVMQRHGDDKKQEKKMKMDGDHFFRQATKDGVKNAMPRIPSSFQTNKFGQRPHKAALDPSLRALIGDECHSTKTLEFNENLSRMFTKVQTNAVRHKNNFKGIEYDLDTKVTKFMAARESRLQEQAELKREKDLDINYKAEFDEGLTEEEVRLKNE